MDGQRRLGTETVHVVHFSRQRKSNLEIRKSMKKRDCLKGKRKEDTRKGKKEERRKEYR